MEELFGPITATFISMIVALLVQVAKSYWNVDGKQALLVSFIIALLFYIPYQLIYFWNPDAIAQMVYSALIYSIAGWLLACGIYSVGKTVLNG